jgi:chitinase
VKASDGKALSTASYSVLVRAPGTPGTNPPYREGTAYKGGEVVTNLGKLYRCKPFPYSGWCGQAAWAYEPGRGLYWADAWDAVN